MLSAIASVLAGLASKIASNPKLIIAAGCVVFVTGIWIHGCNHGRTQKGEEDEAEISALKSRIAQIENAPVREWTEHTTVKAKPEPTDTLTVKGGSANVSVQLQQRLDSLHAAFADSLSRLWDLVDFLATPYDSTTRADTLKVDSLFNMPYRLHLAASSPLDRLLAGQLLVEPFDVHREKLFREITIPPPPKQWHEYLWDILKFVAGVLTGRYIL